MTNPIAVFLVLALLLGLGVDMIWFDSQAALVMVRKFVDLIDWLAFWR